MFWMPFNQEQDRRVISDVCFDKIDNVKGCCNLYAVHDFTRSDFYL